MGDASTNMEHITMPSRNGVEIKHPNYLDILLVAGETLRAWIGCSPPR